MVLFSGACLTLVRDGALLASAWRVLLTAASALCIALFALAHVIHLPPTLSLLLMVSSCGFAAILLLSSIQRRISWRAQVLLLLLTLPLVFNAASALVRHGTALSLQSIGERIVILNAAASFLLLHPLFYHGVRRRSLIIATVVALLIAIQVNVLPHLSQDILRGAFHIHLPSPSLTPYWIVYVLCCFLFVLALLRLTAGGYKQVAIAEGLCLIALSGYQLRWPYLLCLSLVGLTQIMRALLALELGLQPNLTQQALQDT